MTALLDVVVDGLRVRVTREPVPSAATPSRRPASKRSVKFTAEFPAGDRESGAAVLRAAVDEGSVTSWTGICVRCAMWTVYSHLSASELSRALSSEERSVEVYAADSRPWHDSPRKFS